MYLHLTKYEDGNHFFLTCLIDNIMYVCTRNCKLFRLDRSARREKDNDVTKKSLKSFDLRSRVRWLC